MDLEKRREFWLRWWDSETNKIWHLNEKNPDLWENLHLLCPEQSDKSGVFLLPMCGKCLDLKYLYEEGFSVFGVEFCEKIIKEFFEENSLSYDVSSISSDFQIYSTPDEKLRIACGDILALTKDVFGSSPVVMVWDRGAMGAIEKECRKQYARVMKSITEDSQVKYLFKCCEYADWYTSTPPLNCPPEMIQELFGDVFLIEELERIEKKPADSLTVQVVLYLMTTKNK